MRILFSIAAAATLLTSCATNHSATLMPSLESRLHGEWHRTARRIRTGPYIISYHGTARRDSANRWNGWSGRVTGDILLTSPNGVVQIPNGVLIVRPDKTLSVIGAHRTIILE